MNIGRFKNQRGQSTVEAVLLMVLLLGLATLVTNFFREESLLSQLTQGPWVYLAGMVEGGVWLPADEVKKYHPSQWERVRTIDPNTVNP